MNSTLHNILYWILDIFNFIGQVMCKLLVLCMSGIMALALIICGALGFGFFILFMGFMIISVGFAIFL